MITTTAGGLVARLEGIARIVGDGMEVDDPARLRSELMDDLVREAVFNTDASQREVARWLIWSASPKYRAANS